MPVLVKEIMSKPVVTIDQSKTTLAAGKLMKKVRRGCLIVTKNKKPVGIISDSDLIKRVVAKNFVASKIKVKDIMSKPLIAISSNDDIVTAAKKMKKNNISRLPVVDKGKIVGLVSLTDIARTSPEMLYLLEYRLKMKEEPFVIKEKFTSGICDSCGNYSEDLRNVGGLWLCESCREEEE